MSLGENIKRLRKEKGITAKKLAEQAGLSVGYLSDIERDKQDPSLRKLRDIAEALGTTTSFLLKKYREHQEELEIKNYTQNEKELIDLYRQLPEEIKAEIRGEIKGILRTVKQQSAIKRDA